MKEQVIAEKTPLIPKSGDSFDMVIIGAGPAGMSAALCAGRAKLRVLLIDKALPGGQASTSYRVFNYLGFPQGILGSDLAIRMEEHFSRYEVFYTCESVKDIINISGTEKAIKTDLDSVFYAKTIILAVGLEPKQMNKPFEKQFLGRGISYYAQCDGESYRDKDVVVVGGGNCACYAAEYLSEFVNKLYLVHKSDYIKAVKFLSAKMFNNPKIHILWNTDVEDVFGVDRVEKVKLYNQGTNQHTWVDVKGVFVYVGRIPPKAIISPELDVDEDGYIITDEFMRTNIRGVYAAGDIRSKQIRQIATAVADGMIAAINAERDLLR